MSCMDVSWFRHQIDAIRISERTFDFPLTWTRFHRKTLCAAIRLQYTIQWKRQLNWKCSLESLYLFAIDCSKSDQKIINDPTTRKKKKFEFCISCRTWMENILIKSTRYQRIELSHKKSGGMKFNSKLHPITVHFTNAQSFWLHLVVAFHFNLGLTFME